VKASSPNRKIINDGEIGMAAGELLPQTALSF